jgi:hypothetical protein
LDSRYCISHPVKTFNEQGFTRCPRSIALRGTIRKFHEVQCRIKPWRLCSSQFYCSVALDSIPCHVPFVVPAAGESSLSKAEGGDCSASGGMAGVTRRSSTSYYHGSSKKRSHYHGVGHGRATATRRGTHVL